MIYAVRLYTVDVASLPVFAAAFRRGGLWTDIARLFPGHIHTDLLRNPSDSSKFLSIEFWSSVPALVAARRSPEARSFGCWLKRQTIGARASACSSSRLNRARSPRPVKRSALSSRLSPPHANLPTSQMRCGPKQGDELRSGAILSMVPCGSDQAELDLSRVLSLSLEVNAGDPVIN
jgi:hypothetical protein